ncbi:hypothetical protein [Streptomyces sp. BE303]|uniref:hypothetical protein n=1 Tax=Streptomyces sp. BE303 TaxID=3002528 RepID=UPI002E79D01A|nr:hypothetical protein [Streptomyces sp. BE303]MED7954067.1 hypothetical protein [Streptomyces sp. BE303]
MGIGYLLLYGALAVVALWLVAELLLQNRAPLHWRGLALAGFLGVAVGMAMGSVPVIGGGAAMFAVGQTFVTLSVKRGYAAGWSLRTADGGLPGPLAKVPMLGALTGGAAAAAAVVAAERVGEVSVVEEAPEPAPAAEDAPAVEQTAAFAMQELATDGVYAPAYYEQQQTELLQAVPQADPYAEAYGTGYDQQQTAWDQNAQQQWQTPQQPAFAYDQNYGTYQQQAVQQPDPYGTYQQQGVQQPDPYGTYQQQGVQQPDPYGYDQQQWHPQPGHQHVDHHQAQPDQGQGHDQGQGRHGIPQQPQYDQYGYPQQTTWQQQG